MTQTPPPNRRPSPRPAVPPPLPSAGGRLSSPPPAGAGEGKDTATARGRDAAGRADRRPGAAGQPTPGVDVRLLGLVAAVAALLGGGIVALFGPSGPPAETRIAVAPPPAAVGAAPPKPPTAAPEPAPAPRGPSPEELAEEDARRKKEAALKEQEALKNARQQAFRDLKKKLEQAGHLPLAADVKLEAKGEQTISLCDLGAAEVGVALPIPDKLAFSPEPGKTAWKLELSDPYQETWGVKVKDTSSGQTHELAKITVQKEGERRMLSLRLLEMPNDKDPVWVAGRQALTTVPLVLKLRNEASLEFETFMQLCTPKRFDPLQFENLLTEKGKKWVPKGKSAGERFETYALPDTPWPCRVELEGRGPDGITAVVLAAEPQTIASQGSLRPLELTADWVWSGEPKQPFLKTTLSLKNRVFAPGLGGSGALDVQVTGSEVLPPWNGWRRLGELSDSRKPESPAMSQLPVYKRPSSKSSKADEAQEPEYPHRWMVEFADIAFQYVPAFKKDAVKAALSVGGQEPKPMGEWQKTIRELLKKTPGYAGFVNKMAPDPGPRPGEKDQRLREWLEKHERHVKFAAAGPDETKQFWDQLKATPARHQAQVKELVLCCLLCELEPVLAEKQLTERLQEAVGEGTVEFTGRVWVDADNGTHKVLVAEFAAEPEAGKAEDGAREAAAAGASGGPEEVSVATATLSGKPATGS